MPKEKKSISKGTGTLFGFTAVRGCFRGPPASRLLARRLPLCSGVSEKHAQFQRTSVGTFMKTLGGFRPARQKYI